MATINSPFVHDGGNGFEDAGHRQAYQYAEQLIRLKLMDSMTLRGLGVSGMGIDVAGSGSDTARLRYYDDIGAGLSMTSRTEVQSITGSTLTATTSDITTGRYGLRFDQSYESQIYAGGGEIDPEGLAASIVASFEATWMDVLAGLFSSFTNSVGSSGVDMSFDDYLDIVYYFDLLEADAGPLYGLFHGQQLRDLKASVRNEPNFQFPEITQELLRQRPVGYQFDFLGISVHKSSRVTASGGNRIGAVWGPGAIEWAKGSTDNVVTKNPARTIRPPGVPLLVEVDADPDTATTKVYGNAWLGMAIVDDERGTDVTTDQ